MVVKDESEIPDLMYAIRNCNYEDFQPDPVLPMPAISTSSVIYGFYQFVAEEELVGRVEFKRFEGGKLKPWDYDDFRRGQVVHLYITLDGGLNETFYGELRQLFMKQYLGSDGMILEDERPPNDKLLGLCDEISHFLLGVRPEVYGPISVKRADKSGGSDEREVLDTLIVAQTMASRIVYFHSESFLQQHYSEEIFKTFIENYRRMRGMSGLKGPEDPGKVDKVCEKAYQQLELLLDFPNEPFWFETQE